MLPSTILVKLFDCAVAEQNGDAPLSEEVSVAV